ESVWCWGWNDHGGIGNGGRSPSLVPTPTLLRGAVTVDSAGDVSCAVTKTGHVACWGQSLYGEDPVNSLVGQDQLSPTIVPGLNDAVDVSVGLQDMCAIRANGHVACWGANSGGEAGDFVDLPHAIPIDVPNIEDAVEVAVGGTFACARHATGRISCWGR